jgi:hypothetical protein
MPKRFDPAQAETRGYTHADWDAVDAPPLTDEELATARPFRARDPQRPLRRLRFRSASTLGS